VPGTARQHFDEDISRAEAVLAHGATVQSQDADLAADLFRAAAAFAVGAMDAYLCDAYVDCLTRTLAACRKDPKKQLPKPYRNVLLPAGPLISQKYTQRGNWALRMAARMIMEKDNMLSVSRVKRMFNPTLPAGKKLWVDVVATFIALNRKRFAGITRANYSKLAKAKQQKAREKAAAAVLKRIGAVVQRRHDIVHNCDRPKTAILVMTKSEAAAMIADTKSFVTVLDDHLDAHRLF